MNPDITSQKINVVKLYSQLRCNEINGEVDYKFTVAGDGTIGILNGRTVTIGTVSNVSDAVAIFKLKSILDTLRPFMVDDPGLEMAIKRLDNEVTKIVEGDRGLRNAIERLDITVAKKFGAGKEPASGSPKPPVTSQSGSVGKDAGRAPVGDEEWVVINPDETIKEIAKSLSLNLNDLKATGKKFYIVVDQNALKVVSEDKSFDYDRIRSAANAYEVFLNDICPNNSSPVWNDPDFRADYVNIALSFYPFAANPFIIIMPDDKRICKNAIQSLFRDMNESKHTVAESELMKFIKVPPTRVAVFLLNQALEESGGVISLKVVTMLRAMQALTGRTHQLQTFNKYFDPLFQRAS